MYSKQYFISFILLSIVFLSVNAQVADKHDLEFKSLATKWQDGIPLGNGLVGVMLWQDEGNLRMSLDASNLWNFQFSVDNNTVYQNTFNWVYDQILKNNFRAFEIDTISLNDSPLKNKILKMSAGALIFDLASFKSKVSAINLSLKNSLCTINWDKGIRMKTFVHATDPIGWFIIENAPKDFVPKFDYPYYPDGSKKPKKYTKATISNVEENESVFEFKSENGNSYCIALKLQKVGNDLVGVWSIVVSNVEELGQKNALVYVREAMLEGMDHSFQTHKRWWYNFWQQSFVNIPDELIEKQYYRDLYKVGSSVRKDAPPPTLQSVWTADDGSSYPEQGDFHNFMQSQLMNLPLFTSNHLEEVEVYTDWLWKVKPMFNQFTRDFYEKPGLSAPPCSSIYGKVDLNLSPRLLSPSAASWMAYQFYQQWRFTLDENFLRERVYPWFNELTLFFENFSRKKQDGKRSFSASSELSIDPIKQKEWFVGFTNYDLALTKFVFIKGAEIANILGHKEDSERWKQIASEMPDYELSLQNELMIASNRPLEKSKNNLGHIMSVFPLGLLNIDDGNQQKKIIQKTIYQIDSINYAAWTGYTYAWYANFLARATEGDAALKMLKKFVSDYTSVNSFHINRKVINQNNISIFPNANKFTSEGNFLFASAIQEMLLQSHNGIIRIFPALPSAWKDVSFTNLRAENNLLVSAKVKNGLVSEITLKAKMDGIFTIQLPKGQQLLKNNDIPNKIIQITDSYIRIIFALQEGQEVTFIQ